MTSKYKNTINELRLWAEDDIVPADLQGLCIVAANSIKQLEETVQFLHALEAAGVDNREGYEEAVDATKALKD